MYAMLHRWDKYAGFAMRKKLVLKLGMGFWSGRKVLEI